jgi:single-stranded-DNA-specific exonuclease
MQEAALRTTAAPVRVPGAPPPAPGVPPPLHAVPAAPDGAPLRTPPTAPLLELPPYELELALGLERELGIGHVLAQVLVRRGLDAVDDARAFLEPTEAHDPACFEGIERAVALIEHHRDAGSRIVVHGDYDVDGVCATAIMVRALRSVGAEVGWFLPSRTEDGYGLALATVERLAGRGTGLLITVDCGITAVEEVQAARAAGLDVIVTDHHSPRPDGQLPDCALVHPGVCGYPCPELCGTGVAFKLAQALGASTAEEDRDLVALATVADLMPLRGENRRLVREGLLALANTAKPGLRALMSVSRTDPSGLDAYALGFRLAPRINAAGRLRRADAGLELLLTDSRERAKEIASELDALNAERRAVEQRITWEAQSQVAALGPRSAYVLAGEDWHPGVIGIVASRIVEQHHRPTILLALGEGDLPAQGSGRSIPGFDLLEGLHACAPHMLRYGGHRAAAGMTVEPGRVEALREAFERHAEAVLTPDLLMSRERVDAVTSGSELGLGLAEELAALEPCGLGNPRPRLLVPGARFEDVRPMGEGRHARFSVSSGGARARAVAFGCDGGLPGREGGPLDATFRLERNVWKGAVEPRLVLCHARECEPPTITVVGEESGYLDGVFAELERDLAPTGDTGVAGSARPERTVLDRRGESPLAVLRDAGAAGGEVLAVCADVARRLPGLGGRSGGFNLTSHAALERDPALVQGFAHLVALDPPSDRAGERLARAGSGFTHLAWGAAELRFAQQMHELEYGLRASLVALYRALRARERVAGGELERLLRGDGAHPRSARLAGRLIRVLVELELVSLDRALPALAVASGAKTELDRSFAFRVYAQRHEDGRRFLTSANLRPSG